MTSQSQPESDVTSSLVLVFGDDDFEIKNKSSSIIEKWRRDLPDAEFEPIDGNASSVAEVSRSVASLSSSLESLSLFGETKIIWFRNCNFIGSEGRLAQSKSSSETVDHLLGVLKRCDWSQTRPCPRSVRTGRAKRWRAQAATPGHLARP